MLQVPATASDETGGWRGRRVGWLVGGVAAALSLAGCTTLGEYVHNGFKVGPNYVRPPAPVASDWIDAADPRVRRDGTEPAHWWTVFNDPVLDSLVSQASRQNLTLREAGFRIVQARAEQGIAIGRLFPQTQKADGGFTRKALSTEVANRQAIFDRWYNQYDHGFAVAWELDFWGRFRRAIEAADDRLEASIDHYDFILVTLIGDVAQSYVELRTLQQQLEYVRTNIKLQGEALAIAKARFKGGEISELDVDQSTSTLAQTESLIPELEIRIRQTTNKLCILLGIPPEDLACKLGPGPIPKAPPDVAVGIPADLLRRRPDVRREERLAAARSAEIGIAESDFYPAVSLVGQVGFSSEQIGDLLNGRAFRGSVGPSFEWKLLNYGRILNNVARKEAEFQEQVVRYQNSVLNANKEVEDGLVTFLRSHQKERSLAESVTAAEKAVRVAISQYKGGTVDFNRVALLSQNLVEQQDQLAQARGQIALGLVQTYRALGGGWEIQLGDCKAAAEHPHP
jgi:NodT family efflux transporter outer membrane factor (OMF) lipoprotein